MIRFLTRAAAAAGLGALLGGGALAWLFLLWPAVTLPLDTPIPRVLSGFHDIEQVGDLTFAWTGPSATVTLPGLDRRVAWRCAVRARGGRPDGVPQPTMAIDVDGVPAARVTATNLFADLSVDVPARSARDGLTLTIASAPTFVPGRGDPRDLGVQVDHIACEPERGAFPPRRALRGAALATAGVAALVALLGAPLWLATAVAVLVAGLQGLALATGLALYTPYLDRVPWLAGVPAVAALALDRAIAWARGRPCGPWTRAALAYSALALFVLLLALLHPAKSLVDAVFHAHRLEWVHAGRYFFTQPMPSGVSFPYAIALYVVASPWMAVTRDHVALLRIVVCTAHVLTGLLIYATIARRWDDRMAAFLAVVLWSLVPQWFVIVGNANLTAAFAQSVATGAVLASAVLALGPRDRLQAAAVFALAATAFLSHVGTFPLLCVALSALAVTCWWRGGTSERTPARWIALATVLAGVVSVVSYYGHFPEVYRSLDRVTGRVTASAPEGPAAAGGQSAAVRPTSGRATPPVTTRAATAAEVAARAVGWPIALLSIAGAWRLVLSRTRDRLTLALLAWGATSAVFVISSVVGPVEPRFYRYTVEFIGRVIFATWPAVVIAAAAGASWAMRAGAAGRIAATLLMGAAVWVGGRAWWHWIG